MALSKQKLLFVVLLNACSSFADASETAEKTLPALESDRPAFGIGTTFGFPTGLGLQLGAWNLGGGGFINVTGGFFGLGTTLELEGGYLVDNVGKFKQGISLKAGNYFGFLPLPILIGTFSGFYAGPSYKMLFWDLFSIDVGAAFVVNETRDARLFIFIPVDRQLQFGVMPVMKLGLNWFL